MVHQIIIVPFYFLNPHLNSVAEGGVGANLPENVHSVFLHGKPFRTGPDLDNLHHLLLAIRKRPDDKQSVQQVAGDAMGTEYVGPADNTVTCTDAIEKRQV